MAEPVRCSNCKMLLEEPMNVPLEERQPCPTCGSHNRLYSQPLTAQVRSTASLVAVFVAAAATVGYTVAKILQRQPSPEPGYHLQHKHDLVGEGIVFGIAAACLIGFARSLRRRWSGSTFQ
jgi:phage FluMu protein Com